jgi:hypothetical protein
LSAYPFQLNNLIHLEKEFSMNKTIRNTAYIVLSIGAFALAANIGGDEGSKAISIGITPPSLIEDMPTLNVDTTIPVVETMQPATTTTTMPDLSGIDWVALARETYGKCGEWHDLAIQVGWPEEEWGFLSQVIWRESRCQVDAWNGHDAGLTQINQIHTKWLSDMGWNHPEDMFDAEKNLTFAFRLWETSGWKPWRFSGPVPE